MAFLSSLNFPGSALTAQKLKMRVIAQNLANSDTTAAGGAYVKKNVVFAERRVNDDFRTKLSEAEKEIRSYGGVVAVEIEEDADAAVMEYDPDNPAANAQGYVERPGIDTTEEMIKMIEASRMYEANITAFNAIKSMASKALEIGK
jgi:flagellar basal-body rod protein FlgC